MTAEATRAPDKRLQAGAVPATATNTGCYYCDRKDKPIKLKRQYVHHINHRLMVCTHKDNL